MSELCYKLNIPSFEAIIKEDWKQNLEYNSFSQVARQTVKISCESVIDKSFLNFNNISWGELILFPLNNEKSDIHSDNNTNPNDRDLLNPSITLFAINYIISGHGKMEYWMPSQLKTNFIRPNSSYQQVNWITDEPPYKSYDLSPGAYLINATAPHRGSGYDKRVMVSMRPNLANGLIYNLYKELSWEDVVNLFSQYIIEW